MTAQPNDRAVDVLAHIFRGYVATFPEDAELILAAIRDALARGGDDADAIAQAIGLTVQRAVQHDGARSPRFGGRPVRRYVTDWREADRA